LRVSTGVRVGYNSFSGFEVQPNARLLWTITQNSSAWMSVARAIRIPSRSENIRLNVQALPGIPGFPPSPVPIMAQLQGLGHFDSERLIAYEMGFRHQLTSQASFDVTGFYNDYRLQPFKRS